jgi:phosphoglycerate dehydrogenase-like enzyme
LDNVDQEALGARGVALVHAPGANAPGVAEYVLAALFHLARGLPRAAQGEDRLALGGFELAGKTLGLVGLGEVGLRVAHRAKTLGMRVVGYDPLRSPWEAALEVAGVEFLPLEEVLAEAQFLSLHAPLTPETRGLVGREVLARMRPGAYLINTARGELVDHHALYEALRSGHLAGAVLDVTDPEPLPPDHPLRELENCLLTPHIAGLTRESQARVGERVVRGILEVLRAA